MITNKLRKFLHRKVLEMVTPSPYTIGSGCFFASSAEIGPAFSRSDRAAYLVAGGSSIGKYTPDEDAWSFLPASGMAGTFGTGACGDVMRLGMLNGMPTHTATAGTTTAILTTANIKSVLTGSAVRVIAGAGAGYSGTVTTNTIGANSVLSVSPASTTAFNSTTVFQVFSGSLWVFCPGTMAVGFAVYDNATNTWTQKSVAGLPTAWLTTGQMQAVSAAATGNLSVLAGSTATTVNVSGVTWELNAYTNYQIRIASGTGAGQIRRVASHTTAGVVTVTPAWTTIPDPTSVAVIETDEDAIYLGGNGGVTMYRYSIAANAWTTLAPTVARGGAPSAGATFHWIGTVDGWPLGSTGFGQRGRYIYSLRGGGTSVTTFDVYDIALNTWSVRDYGGRGAQVYSTGTCATVDGHGRMFIQHDASGRIYAFDLAANELYGLATNMYPQGSGANANLMFVVPYIDGAERLDFLYTGRHSGGEMFRMLLV